MENKLDIMGIYHLINEYFGKKADVVGVIEKTQELECILYNSFILKCSVEERYQTFGCAIIMDGKYALRNFFGESPSLNNDRVSILESFKLIDKYCRLSLPDKYLVEFEKDY